MTPLDFSGFEASDAGVNTDSNGIDFTDPNGPWNDDGIFANTPGIASGPSSPSSDPYTVGGIFNGLGSLFGGISKIIVADKVSTGAVKPVYLRPPTAAGALGLSSGIGGGASLPMLLLVGAGVYLFFKRKKG